MRLVGFSFTDLFNAFSNAELLLDKESSQSKTSNLYDVEDDVILSDV